jgi:hypothetical protein
MKILDLVRRRASRSAVPAGAAESLGEADSSPADGGQPFAGYNHLNDRQVVDGLSGHTQIELEAVENYERSHKARQRVFDKLRYLRGREPLPGYDALGDEEILAAVEKADLGTIKRVRAYERKFRNRPKVLDVVDRLRRARRKASPASAPPDYQPMSAPPVEAPAGRPPVEAPAGRTAKGAGQ